MPSSYDARMSKELAYTIDSRTAAEQIGAQLRSTKALVAQAFDQAVEWPVPAAADSEESNPCLGIAIGCGLSLLVWGGLLLLFYLVR